MSSRFRMHARNVALGTAWLLSLGLIAIIESREFRNRLLR